MLEFAEIRKNSDCKCDICGNTIYAYDKFYKNLANYDYYCFYCFDDVDENYEIVDDD